MIPLRRNNHVVSQCAYHLVWCTKYRRPVLTSEDPRLGNPVIDGDPGPVDVRLKQIVAEVCQEKEADLLDIEVMPDHVHALIALDPSFGVSKLARFIKGRTSHHLRQEFPSLKRRLPTLWTLSYFVATTGGAPLKQIQQYINDQRDK